MDCRDRGRTSRDDRIAASLGIAARRVLLRRAVPPGISTTLPPDATPSRPAPCGRRSAPLRTPLARSLDVDPGVWAVAGGRARWG